MELEGSVTHWQEAATSLCPEDQSKSEALWNVS